MIIGFHVLQADGSWALDDDGDRLVVRADWRSVPVVPLGARLVPIVLCDDCSGCRGLDD